MKQYYWNNFIMILSNLTVVDKKQQLMKKITGLTLKIEQEFPELYHHLDEDPITIPVLEHPNLDVQVLSDYIESLQQFLYHCAEKRNRVATL